MNRLDQTFGRLKAKGEKALITYIMAGDPSLQETEQLVLELERAGADIIELGIPFSDPMAEGPVIQAAMERALAHKVTSDDVLAMVKKFREKDQDTPIVLMGYVNPIEQYGYERFAKQAKQAGVDGTILVDLPPEESNAVVSLWQAQGLYNIFLCSQTTSEERMDLINNYGKGYLYFVSLKGVTGSDDFDLEAVKKRYQNRKSQTKLPLMVGFGIKTAKMAADVARFADGVIVGAALINQIFDAYQASGKTAAGVSLIGDMRQAMNSIG